jgi:hypothetical protein
LKNAFGIEIEIGIVCPIGTDGQILRTNIIGFTARIPCLLPVDTDPDSDPEGCCRG